MTLKQRTVGVKLAWGLGALSTLILVLAGTGLWVGRVIEHDVDLLADESHQLDLACKVKVALDEMQSNERLMILAGLSQDRALHDQAATTIEQELAAISARIEELGAIAQGEDAAAVATLRRELAEWRHGHEEAARDTCRRQLRGFAVVADEVRSLAQRSAQAARDTAALIEVAVEKTGEGTVRVNEVATAFSSITDSVTKVRGLVEQVSTASRQQSQGIDQIAQAVSQMEKVTQTTAATAEESAAASEELDAQAQTARAVAAELEKMVGRAERGRVRAAPAPSRAAVRTHLQRAA